MLFMQYAVASYVCPGMGTGQVNASTATMQAMPGCTGMDAQQPSLCHVHDQVGNQSLDKPSVPDIPAFTATILTLIVDRIQHTTVSLIPLEDTQRLMRSSAPPLSIRNCCFRI